MSKVSELLRRGANPDALYASGPLKDCSALVQAVDCGNTEIVRALLAWRADPNLAPIGMTPLVASAGQYSAHLMLGLLSCGADAATLAPPFGKSALHIAALLGNPMATAVLIAAGADVDARMGSDTRRTALMVAADRGDHTVVGMLLTGHANPDLADDEGNTALVGVDVWMCEGFGLCLGAAGVVVSMPALAVHSLSHLPPAPAPDPSCVLPFISAANRCSQHGRITATPSLCSWPGAPTARCETTRGRRRLA